VHILESTSEISEIGAGIQCLPNATRVLISWGLQTRLKKIAMMPKKVNMRGWKGELISDMDFHEYERVCGSPFWDFHRAELHAVLLARAEELGARVSTGKRVVDVQCSSRSGEASVAVAVCADGTRYAADLVVGADGVHSRCRELLLGREDLPLLTGDLAYRLLLDTAPMLEDPELKYFVDDPQVNYWIGPDAHAGTPSLSPLLSAFPLSPSHN
jgi:salicylate hydroxylase